MGRENGERKLECGDGLGGRNDRKIGEFRKKSELMRRENGDSRGMGNRKQIWRGGIGGSEWRRVKRE
jgi:hypothetical protein